MGDAIRRPTALRRASAVGVVHRPPLDWELPVDFSFLFEPGGYAWQSARFRARRLVGRAGWTDADRGDLEAEILLRVVGGLRRYDPSRGPVEPLVASIVKAAAKDLLRQRASRKQLAARAVVGLEGEPGVKPANADLRLDFQALLDALPPPLREYAAGMLQGNTATAVGLRQGRSRSSVYRDVGRLRAWLVAAGIADDRPATKNPDKV